MAILICDASMPSSSDASCVKLVSRPWPIPWVPIQIVTLPSAVTS